MKKSIFWFRRDLRLQDNVGLYNALLESDAVACVFVFDKTILNELGKEDKRVDFIWNVISNLKKELIELGSDLIVEFDNPEKIIPRLANKYNVSHVFTNEDYEPKARQRDQNVSDNLENMGIIFKSFKDQAIFSKKEILNANKVPFTIFTHYANSWKSKFNEELVAEYDFVPLVHKFAKFKAKELLSLSDLGFKKTSISKTKIGFSNKDAIKILNNFCKNKISKYDEYRDFPSLPGVSYLGIHNRFGTLSVRSLIRAALNTKKKYPGSSKGVDVWISEIIWRDFYFQILYNFPHVAHEPFNKAYENFQWENDMEKFQKWCMGETGYPLVDAAMNQLNETGYMHNRLRMLVASFLTKHLLIDYRLGEQYFASKLLDFDLSANNGGWQWSASTGCDAQPYFRIFNPILQSEKFDKEAALIKKYIPIFTLIEPKYLHAPWEHKEVLKGLGVELGVDYPMPIVDHKESRERALLRHKEVMQK